MKYAPMHDDRPPAKLVKYNRGKQARMAKNEDGTRKYGPWKVQMEVQLSPLSVTSDTLVFFVYQETGDRALAVAGTFLESWYRKRRIPYDGFPKPAGHGFAQVITDSEFQKTWTQATNSGRHVERAGDQSDPLGFHVRPGPGPIISLPTK